VSQGHFLRIICGSNFILVGRDLSKSELIFLTVVSYSHKLFIQGTLHKGKAQYG
jgi:hypothetical protein